MFSFFSNARKPSVHDEKYRDIGSLHRDIRDHVFQRISSVMNEFENQHPKVMELPFHADGISELVAAENKHATQIRLFKPESIGNFIARACPGMVRSAAAHMYAMHHTRNERGIASIFDGNGYEEAITGAYFQGNFTS